MKGTGTDMKPKKLILCGWGPYKEKQEIDFTKLEERGLFLITGATGAGKTTVFDAITYALYGTMSGETREKNSVRSDFAEGAVPTFAELFMEHGGKSYHIYRNPEYLRPKKRKTGKEEMTREKEKAILTLPDNTKIEGSSEVTKRIQELLRVDYRQFKQLSMIAQGEFARLLSAPPAEKSKIFREIFDTGLYDRTAGELRQRTNNLYRQVMEYRHKMDEDIDLFEPEEAFSEQWKKLTETESYYYEGVISFLETAAKEYKKAEKELEAKGREAEKKEEECAALITEGEQIRNLKEKQVKEEEQRSILETQKPEMEQAEKVLAKAAQAANVRLFEEKWKALEAQKQGLEEKILTADRDIHKLEKKEKEEQIFYRQTEALEAAFFEEKEKEKLTAQLQAMKQNLEHKQKELCKLQTSYLQAEAAEEQSKVCYEAAEKQYRHGIAGILALELKEENPCPVCGSREHPKPARAEREMPTKEKVEQLQADYEAIREKRVALHGTAAVGKEQTDRLREQLKQLEQETDILVKKQAARQVFIAEYVCSHTEDAFFKQKREYEALTATLAEKRKNAGIYEAELQTLKAVCKTAEESYRDACREKGFLTEEEYHAAFLSEEQSESLRKKVSKYRETCHANQRLLAHLKEELAGRQEMDLEKLKQELEEKRERKNRILKEQAAGQQQYKEIRRILTSLREKQEKVQKLSARYSLMKNLDDAANGNNKRRLIFEQYVLASYFEEILRAANIRLRVMTGGRYELKRVQTVGDGRSKDNMEMEVLDYYTGKYRSVKTLSGGEAFKTSLSLALGMSDVVQAFSGGIRVETLFIDEGFGSLDSESLEQACLTLQSLVEKDRLIGIISHVPELAEKIRNQIRIRKTNAGSTIEVMVF